MSENEISVLSVRNPYADCIIYGDKEIELRTWKTDYRGRLYIHAGKQPHKIQSGMDCDGCVFGAIIGYVDLVDVRPMNYDDFVHHSNEHKCYDSLFAPNMYGWFLQNPIIINPIPCAGKLWIFKMPESVLG